MLKSTVGLKQPGGSRRGRQNEGQLFTPNERHQKAVTASLHAGSQLPPRAQIPPGSKNESKAHKDIFCLQIVYYTGSSTEAILSHTDDVSHF